jgi:hypothetical protein
MARPVKPKPRKATPKNKVSKRARRVVIAKALVEQHRPAEIAHAIGVSRKTIYEELKHPETQELIREWMKPHHSAIRRMIPRALAAVNTGLKPRNDMIDRLRAVKVLGNVMTWAQGKEPDGETGRPKKFEGTMEELLILYRKVTSESA